MMLSKHTNTARSDLWARRICAVLIAWGLFTSVMLAGMAQSVRAASIDLPEITTTKITYNSQKTRFTAEISAAIGYNVYVLEKPYRVVIDLPDAIFNLSPINGMTGAGLVTGFRFGQLGSGRSRIVLDVKGPVLIENSYAVRKKPGRPARLIVDLVRTDATTFAKIHQADQVTDLVARQEARKKPETNDDGIIPQDHPLITKKFANRQLGDPIATLLNNKKPGHKPANKKRHRRGKFLVVIDPGHGGIDSGTVSLDGVKEKDVVLAFARALEKKLKQLGRYEVILTRRKDRFVSLRSRVAIAHKHAADLFIAVHADSIRHRRVRGATVYTLSEKASDKEAAELAAKENQADLIGGVDLAGESKAVTNILIDLAQRETKNHSLYFAKKTIQHLKGVTRLTKRPMRSAGFVVLKAPDVPSILIELGYLSNRHDASLISSGKWQKKVSKAIAHAIGNYFRAKVALK